MPSSESFLCIVTSSVAIAAATPALAQQVEAKSAQQEGSRTDTNGEILVTAQRRSERQRDVPIAITAIAPERLQQMGVMDMPSLQRITPGLNFATGINYSQTYIRGVGSEFQQPGREPAVATYIDGAYVSRGFGNQFDMLDAASVEVLRGPQGTLWGRNASGGALILNSADPKEDLGGALRGELGSLGHTLLEGMLNLPISDTVSTRFAVRYRHDGGFIRNLSDGFKFGGRENFVVRGKVAFRPTTQFSAVFQFQFDKAERSQGPNAEYLAAGFCAFCSSSVYTYPIKDPFTTAQNVINGGIGGRDTSRFINLRMKYEGDLLTVSSTTAYRNMQNFETGDFDYTEVDGFNIWQDSGSKSFTQDVVLSTNTHSMVNFTAGASYLNDKSWIGEYFFTGVTRPSRPYDVYNLVATDSASGFGEVTLEPVKGLKIIGGARYTYDRRKIFDTHVDFNSTTPRFVVSYSTGNVNVYASYNRGFKAGGYNVPAPNAQVFLPENIDSYEAGLKYQSSDRKFRGNLAVFTYNYKDIQTAAVDQANTENIGSIQNTNGKGSGVEVDFDYAPSKNLHLFGGGSYLDAHYSDFSNASVQVPFYTSSGQPNGMGVGIEDLSNTPFPQAPKWSGFIGVTLGADLPSGWRGELTGFVRYTSEYFFHPGGSGPLRSDKQDDLTVARLNGRIMSPDEKYEIGFYVDNLTDKRYYDFRFITAPFGGMQYMARPRTYGVSLAAKF